MKAWIRLLSPVVGVLLTVMPAVEHVNRGWAHHVLYVNTVRTVCYHVACAGQTTMSEVWACPVFAKQRLSALFVGQRVRALRVARVALHCYVVDVSGCPIVPSYVNGKPGVSTNQCVLCYKVQLKSTGSIHGMNRRWSVVSYGLQEIAIVGSDSDLALEKMSDLFQRRWC